MATINDKQANSGLLPSPSGIALQAKRLVGIGDGEQASANAYIALIGLVGVVGWGMTAAFKYGVTREVELFGIAGFVVLLWVGLYFGRMLTNRNLDDGVTMSSPFLLWTALIVLAFMANGAGLVVGDPKLSGKLMCMPWLVAFTIGYLMTGVLVDRGWVYYLAGAVGAGIFVYAVPLGNGAPPFPLLVLGTLNAVPMFVDAALGGRELMPDGRPRVAADRSADVSVKTAD